MRKKKEALSQTAVFLPRRSFVGKNGGKSRARPKKTPGPPKLPENDVKVICRLPGGLNVSKEVRVVIQRSIQRAAQLASEETERDAFRFNDEQNTLIVKTPVLENALKYEKVNEIRVKVEAYEVAAYATPPEKSVKGVIHGIPDEDTEQDILDNL